MNPSFVLFGSLIGLVLIQILLWAVFLLIGLRWAKVKGVTIWQAIIATVVAYCLQLSTVAISIWVDGNLTPLSDYVLLVHILLSVLIPIVIVKAYFKSRFWRSVQAWLPTLIPQVAILLFLLLIVRPFGFEAFSISANSMAPTLLGPHLSGKCEVCNGPAFGSPNPHDPQSNFPINMICKDHLHTSRVKDFDRELNSGDRIAVAKFIEPKRWDIVAFRLPSQPDMIYVKRLVGLPGEQIEIKAGGVWADGKRLEPPEAIREIEYLSEIPLWRSQLWGTANRPATLGPDEYFVLGDYSAASMDSRFWNHGAPDHNPYAVPKSHIHGVVTHIYWPVSRWRALE
jgi:signal peptidase I